MILRCIFVVVVLSNILFACAHAPQSENSVSVDLISSANTGDNIAALAKTLLGSPYKYGGATPKGFDCSGLVFYTHGKLGIATPRSSLQQYRSAKRIQLNEVGSGDLVFFKLNRKVVSHVGIYIGNGQFIHAPKRGKRVAVGQLKDQFWKPRIVGAGRLH